MSPLPPWYMVALDERLKEVAEAGDGSSPRILEYLATCSDLTREELRQDTTPWCSAFVNWCVRQCGIAGTNSAWARSWAEWGKPIETPVPGSIAVWARGRNSPTEPISKGHVGFVVEDYGDALLVLGGNQRDAVSIGRYPKQGYLADTTDSKGLTRELYELLGYRWPGISGTETTVA